MIIFVTVLKMADSSTYLLLLLPQLLIFISLLYYIAPFTCAPYSVTSTASATTAFAICNVGLCGGDAVTMSVCPGYGSFTGG